MSHQLLKGKKGIIFGALDPNSIAWITAERVHEEGGEFVLTNAPIAMRMGTIDELAEKTGSISGSLHYLHVPSVCFTVSGSSAGPYKS